MTGMDPAQAEHPHSLLLLLLLVVPLLLLLLLRQECVLLLLVVPCCVWQCQAGPAALELLRCRLAPSPVPPLLL